MKKVLFFFLLLFSTGAFAQVPAWKVDEPAYQYTMTLVAKCRFCDAKRLK